VGGAARGGHRSWCQQWLGLRIWCLAAATDTKDEEGDDAFEHVGGVWWVFGKLVERERRGS
jgi:hypothetical protein